jgi:hypothetical protein
MKVCEVCGGIGHAGTVLCLFCQGTGLISLGHESAERYAELVIKAREKAAHLGWQEEVWEPIPLSQRECYPYALARKVRVIRDNREPPEPDREAFRGGEAAAFHRDEQVRIQRELK